MSTYHLIVSSPDGNVFDGEVSALYVRGVGGDLAVLKGHIPFVTSLKPCICRFTRADGETVSAHTNGGLLTVGQDVVTLLSDSFTWQDTP